MFEISVQPDYEALLRNPRREGTPQRVRFMELLLDNYLAMMDEGRRYSYKC